MNAAEEETRRQADYWTLIRDVGVLQVKLLIDGFRDLVLLPTSLIAGFVSLANSKDGRPGPQFYRLIAVGKQSEHWINLFGAIRNSPESHDDALHFGDADIDDIVSRVETFVVDECKRGGVTKQAKARIHKALEAMQRGKEEKS